MKKLVSAFVLSTVAVTTPLATQADGHEAELLFVQSARDVKVDGGRITLVGVSPVVVFFSDRPKRLAGHVTMAGFLQAWDEGKDSFKGDPPNANVSVFSKGAIENMVVELTNPRLKGDNLQYEFRLLSDRSVTSSGATSVFIDGLFSGGVVSSGARGAALGAIGGAIGGNPGAGAAIGTAVGVLGGAIASEQ